MKNKPTPPRAPKIPKKLTAHGHTRTDDYYWLRERENAQTIDYLNAENAFRESEMRHTEELQETLFQEIKGRIKEDDQSVPYFKNGYWYYVRFEKGEEHPIYCRKPQTLEAQEEILLNINELAANHSYYKVNALSVSRDNKILAFGEDTVSRRIYTIRFKNLETNEFLDDKIENTTGSAAWAADNRTLFYTVKDASLRPFKVFKHVLGNAPTADVEIFHEADETFTCGAYKSKSQEFLMIASSSTVSNEYRYLPANQPDGEFQIIQKRERFLEYSAAHFEKHWYILTNTDGATNFKLMRAPLQNPAKENWETVMPHREKVYLENVEIFKKYLVTEERENGLTKIRIQRWDGGGEHFLAFAEETYTAGIGNNPEFDTTVLRYGYSSLTVPPSVIDYNMESRAKTVMKQLEVVGGHDPEEYQSERVWATVKPDGGLNVGSHGRAILQDNAESHGRAILQDNGESHGRANLPTAIPISLVYKKSLKKDEGNPLLLYGYGAYGITVDAGFSSVRLSLLDRGFVFAIAHVRGGEYLGREWYETGRMEHKMNTFTDFIACAETLIDKGLTTQNQLYAMGGSAGGLLMGAVVNLRPNLFKGIIAAVPFVDALTTMLDDSIPLTTGEYDEWGNPNLKEFYDTIKSYSPYDNVKAQKYPAMLVTTGLHDSQVQYWEPAKWVAKLRELKTDENPLYLYINMETGHGGAAGRYEAYRETAMEYAFLLMIEKSDGLEGDE